MAKRSQNFVTTGKPLNVDGSSIQIAAGQKITPDSFLREYWKTAVSDGVVVSIPAPKRKRKNVNN